LDYILYALQMQMREDASAKPEDKWLVRGERSGSHWWWKEGLLLGVVVKNFERRAEFILIMESHVFSNGYALRCFNEDFSGFRIVCEGIAMVGYVWDVWNAQIVGYPVCETQAGEGVKKGVDQVWFKPIHCSSQPPMRKATSPFRCFA
jgi:hypothetical protein